MEKTDIAIIGAGAVGLAVAFRLSEFYKDIFIIERNSSFGQETSSRNSEVIHGGMYYPPDSLKKKTCIEGRRLLYQYCRENDIPHKKVGKLIVAIDPDEIRDLEALFKQGQENGVEGLKLLSKEEIKKIEPNIRAEAAIYSPETGIIDSHSFMKNLVFRFERNNGFIVYNSEVTGIDKTKEGFEMTLKSAQEGELKLAARVVINAAGLNSDKVARMAGLMKDEYTLKYCKGDYFRSNQRKAKFINHLIYPVPVKDHAGLGVHATLDLAGGLRFGPDTEYVKEIYYDIDPKKGKSFYESIRRFLPFMEEGDLSPDTAGMRPKLQGEGEGFRDFIIKEESANHLPGLINLIGIESPGLTGALSIGGMVKGMVDALC
ncbi:MAG TPA: NAD(P)/FAD-dependent oxidoreductase [Candidatus Omnitrophota bacterium]|nr:NAD(P)/FAD-dependent oxidoreductase [Candidatus Omnitrophota bacterium]HPD85494.1 NAD(P)/FAD-dependent oxidoreductase [Candidatus Omnitrophota bacterium]HRZ04005.1 NAD(P)/FAD-dependent oxidoreductase [Candidatus Omnitrophota bacterium]